MLPIHPIKYHRSGQNAGRRAKSGTSHTRQRSDGTNLFRCFNQMRIGKQYTCMLGVYITKKLAIQSSYSIYFQAQATLNEPATVNVINFQAVVKRKGLVSSSYTSAAELSTTITDRLREQWGATHFQGAVRLLTRLRANNALQSMYQILILLRPPTAVSSLLLQRSIYITL